MSNWWDEAPVVEKEVGNWWESAPEVGGDLPAGVKPSTAGGGRGYVSPGSEYNPNDASGLTENAKVAKALSVPEKVIESAVDRARQETQAFMVKNPKAPDPSALFRDKIQQYVEEGAMRHKLDTAGFADTVKNMSPSDLVKLWGSGSASLARGAGELFGSDALRDAGNAADAYYRDGRSIGLSNEFSPTAGVISAVGESLPGTAAGVALGSGVGGIVGRVAGGAAAGATSAATAVPSTVSGLIKAIASAKAPAVIGGALGEGGVSALSGADQAAQEFDAAVKKSAAGVLSTPRGKELMASTGDPQLALKALRDEAVNAGARNQGAATAIGAALIPGLDARVINKTLGNAERVTSKGATDKLLNVARETGQEFVQGYGEQVGGNLAASATFDPTRQATEGALVNASMSGIAGTAMAGVPEIATGAMSAAGNAAKVIRDLAARQQAPRVEDQPTTPQAPTPSTTQQILAAGAPAAALESILQREGLTTPNNSPASQQAPAVVPSAPTPDIAAPTAPAPAVSQDQYGAGTAPQIAQASTVIPAASDPVSRLRAELETLKSRKTQEVKPDVAQAPETVQVQPKPQTYTPSLPQVGQAEGLVQKAKNTAAKYRDLSNDKMYSARVLDSIEKNPQAGAELVAAVRQEKARRRDAIDKKDAAFAAARSGDSADIGTSRAGARPLSVERGLEIARASRDRALMPQETAYMDALKAEIGDESFSLVRREGSRPYAVRADERKFALPRIIEQNRAAISKWDAETPKPIVNSTPVASTKSAPSVVTPQVDQPTQVKFSLPTAQDAAPVAAAQQGEQNAKKKGKATKAEGQSAEDSLVGRGSIFDEPAPAAQAAAILDAANVTGKERINALKDVKKGDITPDELQAAYPAKEVAAPISDAGEKIDGARKDVDGSTGPRAVAEKEHGVAMFSSGTSSTGLPHAQVSAIVNAIKSQWENAPDIIVAANMADPAIPQAVRDYDQLQKSQGAQGEPEGFVYRGKVHLIADQLPTSADVIRVLFHESLGHMGLSGAYGDTLKPILQQISTMRKADVAAKAAQYGLDMSKEADRLAAAEEVLAEMAQTRPEIGFVTRAVAAIRAWLRKHVPGFSSLAMKDSEIIAKFLLPARRFIEGRVEKQQGTAGELAFVRGKNGTMANNDVVGNQGGRSADDTTKSVPDYSKLTLGQAATAIAKRMGALKSGEGLAYGGKSSRYYDLPDKRILRVSDHEFPRQYGQGVADISVVIDEDGITVTTNQLDQLRTKIEKQIGSTTLGTRGEGQQDNFDGIPIPGWYNFNEDTKAQSQALAQLLSRVKAGENPVAALDEIMQGAPVAQRLGYAANAGAEAPNAAMSSEDKRNSITTSADDSTPGDSDTYRRDHTAPTREYGAPLSDITENGIYPDSAYGQNASRDLGRDVDAFTLNTVARLKGKPDALVKIYRAVPKGIEAEIKSGDWVAISKEYANYHGRKFLKDNFDVIEKTVRAGDVFTDGNSIHEWGYEPENESTAPDSGGAKYSRVKTTQAGYGKIANKTPSPWVDDLGRLRLAPGRMMWDWLGKQATPMLDKLYLTSASPEMRHALRKMKIDVQHAQDVAGEVATEVNKLSIDERSMISDVIENELRAGVTPTANAVRTAAMMNTAFGIQTDELVRLGMLSKEASDKWRGKYLPRFYESKIGSPADTWASLMSKRQRRPSTMAGIKGKHLKGRGLTEVIPVYDLPDWEAKGWEVRDKKYDPATSKQVTIWRDFTKDEREKMGEIRDSGFRFVMGYMQTQKDIALGRMFESISQNPDMASDTELEGFVAVPDTTIPDTGAKRYGMLAGMYVTKDVMSQLSVLEEMDSAGFALYKKALSIWKEGKTVLNPVAHVNNFVSNLTMAHLAGVNYLNAKAYGGAIKDLATGAAGVKEARDAGLFLGRLSDEELLKILPKDLQAMLGKQDSAGIKGLKLAHTVLTWGMRRPASAMYEFGDSFFKYLLYKDARARGLKPEAAVDHAQKYIFTYDDLPKGARKVRDFAIPFFSYTYKAVPALAETVMVYPHRFFAPAGIMYLAGAAAYAVAAGGDDDDWMESIKRYVTDSDYRKKADAMREEEYKLLPEWNKGYTAFGTPKTMRLGTDDKTQNPVFIDVSRFIPGGDLFDAVNNAGGAPLLAPITPNNPILSIYSAIYGNRDLFTGKDVIDKMTDTPDEQRKKQAEWLWKAMTPAIAVSNYHWDRAVNVVAKAIDKEVPYLPDAMGGALTGVGKDGQPVQPKYAAMNTLGVKSRPMDLELSSAIQGSQTKKTLRELEARLSQAKRLNAKGAMSYRIYEKTWAEIRAKEAFVKEGKTLDGEDK